MNYRSHLKTPSAVRIDVTVADHPEFDRTLELPLDAPRSWLAEAYLLSVGFDPPSEMEPSETEPDTEWDCAYPEARWEDYGQVARERRLHLSSFPHEIVARRGYAYDATLGEQAVAVLDVGCGTALGQPSSEGWQTTVPPFRIDRVNEELAHRFGIVLPYFNTSSIDGVERSARPSSLIHSLLTGLTPVRRLALRDHLDDCGLLEDVPLRQSDALSATEAVRTVLHRVGDGMPQDAESGWLPTAFIADLAGDLGWDLDGAQALVSFLREARMLRRLRGEVIVTALGKRLLSEPARGVRAVANLVTTGDSRPWSYGTQTLPCFETAAALLAIADGSALTLAELPKMVAAVSSMKDHNREDRRDDYMFGGLSDAGFIASQLEILAARFRMLSEPGAYGEITSAMRSVARAALM
jgi:hypothetical protein